MPEPVTLAGRAVRLEPLADRHAPALAAVSASQPETFAFLSVPHGLEEAHTYIRQALEEQEIGASLPFAVVRLADESVVGSTRLCRFDYWRAPSHHTTRLPAGDPALAVPCATQIGATWLAADARGGTINTESKYLLLTHAFESWRVRRVALQIDARNTRSMTAVARLGITCDGIRRAHTLGRDGEVRDTAFFSVLDTEWPDLRSRILDRLTPRACIPVC
ncbi:GNAT family N-acetyltransferase [Streptomyces sp. NPDC091376]|uniref:GNAT family N-acetyltransferase n=1 Tax=Streptomyces sp. NPDC091376 TaxID=3365994 RepID=UPI003806D240